MAHRNGRVATNDARALNRCVLDESTESMVHLFKDAHNVRLIRAA
jgi:hypothetical protein